MTPPSTAMVRNACAAPGWPGYSAAHSGRTDGISTVPDSTEPNTRIASRVVAQATTAGGSATPVRCEGDRRDRRRRAQPSKVSSTARAAGAGAVADLPDHELALYAALVPIEASYRGLVETPIETGLGALYQRACAAVVLVDLACLHAAIDAVAELIDHAQHQVDHRRVERDPVVADEADQILGAVGQALDPQEPQEPGVALDRVQAAVQPVDLVAARRRLEHQQRALDRFRTTIHEVDTVKAVR